MNLQISFAYEILEKCHLLLVILNPSRSTTIVYFVLNKKIRIFKLIEKKHSHFDRYLVDYSSVEYQQIRNENCNQKECSLHNIYEKRIQTKNDQVIILTNQNEERQKRKFQLKINISLIFPMKKKDYFWMLQNIEIIIYSSYVLCHLTPICYVVEENEQSNWLDDQCMGIVFE